MTTERPTDAASDPSPLPDSLEADPEKGSTPGGVVRELEELAEADGATTGPPDGPEHGSA